MVRVTVSSVLYFYASDPEGPAERWEPVSLPLLQSIEHIEAPAQDKCDPPGWLGLGDHLQAAWERRGIGAYLSDGATGSNARGAHREGQ